MTTPDPLADILENYHVDILKGELKQALNAYFLKQTKKLLEKIDEPKEKGVTIWRSVESWDARETMKKEIMTKATKLYGGDDEA